jgi:hypothetical protein
LLDPQPADKPVTYAPLSETLSKLLEILIAHIQRREISRLTPLGPHKDAVIAAAFKVPFPLDTAVVLACRFIKRDADPNAYTGNLRDEADEGNRTPPGI